mmetsp:Transcript_9956/g.23929  ORF Transcript_9956/g.23929 Transcript_9956/m.23929 type:complete len:105 (-) Transcript_9956:436-750(-)
MGPKRAVHPGTFDANGNAAVCFRPVWCDSAAICANVISGEPSQALQRSHCIGLGGGLGLGSSACWNCGESTSYGGAASTALGWGPCLADTGLHCLKETLKLRAW